MLASWLRSRNGEVYIRKTWLITGASSGLGRSMAERLLARGDHVVATVRSKTRLEDLAGRYRAALRIEMLDVSDGAAARLMIDRVFGDLGRIDVVVSNAGYGLFGAAEELSDAQIDRQVATNLTGSIQLIRASLPHLRAQRGGRIVQLSSAGGQVAYPNFSLYHATKWGIEGFVKAVAQEVRPFGVDFILVEPGPTLQISPRISTAPSLCRCTTRPRPERRGASSPRVASEFGKTRVQPSTASSRRQTWTTHRSASCSVTWPLTILSGP